jgi:signal transduction histidine kinase
MHNDSELTITIAVISGMLLLGLIITLYISFVSNYVKTKSQLLAELTQKELEHKTHILASELEMQEQTFEHISREIHDNWGQRLSLLKLQIQQVGIKADTCETLIEELIEELRSFSRHMSSSRVKKIGLINSIEEDITLLRETTPINFQLNLDLDSSNISEQTGLILYRIFQEAESNILRHSGARTVVINLKEVGDEIVMEIIDDGKGFDTKIVSERGIGLHNISKRSRLLNGNCQLLSELGKGTKIEIKILKD